MPPSWKTIVWPALLLYVLTLLAYAPSLRGGYLWDDDDYVTNNPNLRSPRGLIDIWTSPRSSPQYYPMVFTSFWVEHQLWGFKPIGYRMMNVLLHATGAALLWRVLVKLQLPAAFLAACVFALHPVHAESVAWITERKNILSAVFYFASGLTYVAWASRPSDRAAGDAADSPDGTPRPRFGLYILSLLLFIAALLSKTVTCSLPAALLLIAWWKRGRVTRRDVAALAPFFAMGLALGMTTVWLERSHVEAVGPEWDLSPIDRLLIAGRAVWFYAAKLALPLDLSFVYPRWTIDPRDAIQWTFPVAALVAIFVLWRMRDHWGRGPLTATLIFAGTLVPALGFFNIYPMRYTFVADHYAYHASVGLIVLLGAGLHRLSPRGAFVVLAALLVLTMARARVFADGERLWRDTLAKNPHSWMVHLNLAKILDARGNDAEARFHFQRQVELGPDVADTHMDYGTYLANSRRFEEAVASYQRAIQLRPDVAHLYLRLGRTYLKMGRPEDARVQFENAARLDPSLRER